MMIEEGPEWIAHQKTRSHRRLAAKIKGSSEKELGGNGRIMIHDSTKMHEPVNEYGDIIKAD